MNSAVEQVKETWELNITYLGIHCRYQRAYFDVPEVQRMIWPGNSLDLNMLEMCLPYLKRITRPCTLARKHGLNFSVPPQDYIQRISPTTSPFLEFNSELQLI